MTVIGRDDALYAVAYRLTVALVRLGQLSELSHELLAVDIQLVPYVDEIVRRLLHALGVHQNLLKQLLAGAQAGVFDLDVDVWLEAGEPDHVPREIVYAHGIAHVEHEYLAAGRCP